MAAPLKRNQIVHELISNKVSVSRPPSAKLTNHSKTRYASKYALKNRNLVQVFNLDCQQTSKQSRVQSAQMRHGTAIEGEKPRRVKSASVTRTKEYVSEQFKLYTDQRQMVLYNPDDDSKRKQKLSMQETLISPAKSSLHHTGRDTKASTGCASVPSSFNNLEQYTKTELPDCLDHPALRGSLVVLPGLGDTYGYDLPTLPSLHNYTEDYPFTHSVPLEHVHKPKKYTHPYYERLKKMKGWTCNHTGREVRVGSVSGETIHRYTIAPNRNKNAVRDEIVELERLIKGLSTEWGTCRTVLYQNEINDLQRMVKHTLSMTGYPETPPETPDPTGLRKFCKEYDTALLALIDRHQQCMLEIKKMEEMDHLYERAKLLEAL